MQVHPTRAAAHLALCGALLFGGALLFQKAAIVAWAAGIVVGLAVARTAAVVSIRRIRSAGFEMIWASEGKLISVPRGTEVELTAQVRNRDSRAARFVNLRALASSSLGVRIEPKDGEIAAGGRLRVSVYVSTPRVGQHAVHGLSLQVQGATGLFETPLTFANPFGIEVLPRPFASHVTARGGRSRHQSDSGSPGRAAAEGSEFRELRDYHSGDPFKRIAWKASARRGRLLVRQFDKEHRDLVWVVLDASAELWAGAPGQTPLDLAIDDLSSVAAAHLGRGDMVGLAVAASRLRALIQPNSGPKHAHELSLAMVIASSTFDAGRNELSERDVALRVLEHLRPIMPQAAGVPSTDLDEVVKYVRLAIVRAPFLPPLPEAPSQRESLLRQYLAAFGIDCPARSTPERAQTDEAIVRLLERIAQRKPHPSIVYIASPAPEAQRPELIAAVNRLRRVGAEIRWISARHEPSIPSGTTVVERAVGDALVLRARVARDRGEQLLRRIGVRVHRVRSPLQFFGLGALGKPNTADGEAGVAESEEANE